ncbi:hypothetical protein MASR2M15_04720 [Anaerolineales bacterium]
MISIPRFFRKEVEVSDHTAIDIHVMDPSTDPIPSIPYTRANTFNNIVDPARKALLSQIAIVSVEENADLPALLNEESRQSAIAVAAYP